VDGSSLSEYKAFSLEGFDEAFNLCDGRRVMTEEERQERMKEVDNSEEYLIRDISQYDQGFSPLNWVEAFQLLSSLLVQLGKLLTLRILVPKDSLPRCALPEVSGSSD